MADLCRNARTSQGKLLECGRDQMCIRDSPKATEEICGMLDMIGTLIEKGHAYVAEDGTVYYLSLIHILKRGARARSTKQKARLQRYEELKNREALSAGSQIAVSYTHLDVYKRQDHFRCRGYLL